MKESQWRSRLVKEFKLFTDPRFIWAMDAKFKAGFPDLYIIYEGNSFHYELKVRPTIKDREISPFSEFEKIQISVINEINRCGGTARGLILVEDTKEVILVDHHLRDLHTFKLKDFYVWWATSDHAWPTVEES